MDFFLQRFARILITTSATYKGKVDIKVKVVDRVNGGTFSAGFFYAAYSLYCIFTIRECVTPYTRPSKSPSSPQGGRISRSGPASKRACTYKP